MVEDLAAASHTGETFQFSSSREKRVGPQLLNCIFEYTIEGREKRMRDTDQCGITSSSDAAARSSTVGNLQAWQSRPCVCVFIENHIRHGA